MIVAAIIGSLFTLFAAAVVVVRMMIGNPDLAVPFALLLGLIAIVLAVEAFSLRMMQ